LLPRNQRVWVVAEDGDELHIEGDLLVLHEIGIHRATLYRTVETYVEPSQGIIDKWHFAEKPYFVDPKTHLFRMLEEVESCVVHNESDIRELFESVPPL
jgi:hypothetical protein